MKPGKYYEGSNKIIYIYLNKHDKQRGVVIELTGGSPLFHVGDMILPTPYNSYKEITDQQQIKQLDKKRLLMGI